MCRGCLVLMVESCPESEPVERETRGGWGGLLRLMKVTQSGLAEGTRKCEGSLLPFGPITGTLNQTQRENVSVQEFGTTVSAGN